MTLRRVNISSPRLKELVFQRCGELVEFELDTPNLSIFKCWNSVDSFSSNALALSQTLLCFISPTVDNEWYLKFSQLLAKFNLCSNVLNLQCNHEFSYKKTLVYEGETRCCQCLPLSCWKHCIKKAKIECTEKHPTTYTSRESYSSEDGEIMEKIDDLWRSLWGI
ncbi:hypothetical protein CICLE_v10002726mg [Citrus x clementina]|uniref:FBD domain-containing protein n=1 Tax=Citrus clementina TaxID=85681 RepID=V4T798_CITCL|nr:hypothetical protein CICLE_v10002726mg [Citrus x clementina]